MNVRKFYFPKVLSKKVMDIAQEQDKELVSREVASLDESNCLFKVKDFSVYCVDAVDIPLALKEIGRLREITFRGVGEGSNKDEDLDEYDVYYKHLFIWDNTSSRIVGAYRLGQGDLSADPLTLSEYNINQVKKLWNTLEPNQHPNLHRYPELTSIFFNGFNEYKRALTIITRFIGGTEINRNYIPDPSPINPVNTSIQKKALSLLTQTVLNPEEFNFSPELLNILSKDRRSTIQNKVWKEKKLIYEIHPIATNLQNHTFSRLFSPYTLNRILDNEHRTLSKEPFTLPELFITLTSTVFDTNQSNTK